MTLYGSGLYGSGIYEGSVPVTPDWGVDGYAIATFAVAVDWNRDGNFTTSGDNVTDRVRRQAGLSFEYGRDQSTALAPTVAGRGQFTLNNSDRRFSPRNTLSPIYPNIKPARPVRVQQTLGATTYILFRGHTDDTPINPSVDNKDVNLSLVDSLADFRGLTISTAVYQGIRTGEAIDVILDECGWTGTRDLDNGGTVIPFWWEDNADAFTALETLVRCEGPPALLHVGSDGGIVFKDRHHRLLDAASITSQGTWTGVPGAAEPVMQKPFIYDDAWRNIINHGLASVDVRYPQNLQQVWATESPVMFTASQTRTFIATGSDPFINAVTPVSGTDYNITAGTLSSVTLSRTSGGSTTITIVAGGGGAQLDGLQLRAYPIQVTFTQQVTASDSASITAYGQRSFPGDLEFCNLYDADAILESTVDMRAQPLPIVTVRFVVGTSTARAAAVLTRDLSDLVTIVEPETVLNNSFFVESIAHEMTSEYDHTVTIGCELAPPAGTVTPSNVFILGSAVSGHRLGTGKLAA